MNLTKDMTITDILNAKPGVEELLRDKGMHCISCMAASGETLEQALLVHGYPPEEITLIVEELNSFSTKQEASV